jgi:hypothetical protein
MTGWSSRTDSIRAIKNRLPDILKLLKQDPGISSFTYHLGKNSYAINLASKDVKHLILILANHPPNWEEH